jgi:hypothetical protein
MAFLFSRNQASTLIADMVQDDAVERFGLVLNDLTKGKLRADS